MERAAEEFAALCFLVIGVSHLFQPLAWVEFFAWLHNKGRAGMFVEGFLSLTFGAFIASFHNVWSGWGVVLTVIGWGQVVKGAARFVAPQLSLRVYKQMTPERAWLFRVGGVFALAISGFLTFTLFR